MSLPNDQATRLGGALLSGGGGISAAYANLPSEILTRTLLDYEYFDFTNPVDTGKSVATDGIGLATVNAQTQQLGWLPAKQGSAVYTSRSGQINGRHDWGHVLEMSPGSAASTGWTATRTGAAAQTGTLGPAGGISLGIRGYPRRLAFGGSCLLDWSSATASHRAYAYFGLTGATTDADLTEAAGTFVAAEGIVLQIDPDGKLYVVGRRGSAGTKTRVASMLITLPTAATEFSKLDWVVVGEYTNSAVSTTFGQVDVYIRNYVTTTTTSTTRPPANFTKCSINSVTATAINLPNSPTFGTAPLYPMIGACSGTTAADTADFWCARSFWYALERS